MECNIVTIIVKISSYIKMNIITRLHSIKKVSCTSIKTSAINFVTIEKIIYDTFFFKNMTVFFNYKISIFEEILINIKNMTKNEIVFV